MKSYLKPSILIFSSEGFGAKLQGSGASLLCSGTECDRALGASCVTGGNYNYVAIDLFERGVTCPQVGLPSCVVTSITIGSSTYPSPDCWVQGDSEDRCDNGCGLSILCNSSGLYCNEYMSISATVSCSGFGEMVTCAN